jgi:imidazolonepropionase-like amidohydrolase
MEPVRQDRNETYNRRPSLTTAPAERFGESTRLGRIAPRFMADMVVLDEDPSKDVRAFAAVRDAVRDGKITYEAKTDR